MICDLTQAVLTPGLKFLWKAALHTAKLPSSCSVGPHRLCSRENLRERGVWLRTLLPSV